MARGEHHRIHAHDRQRRNRHRVAQEAARLISEHGIRDYRHAKLKAAERLGFADEQSLPGNREVEDALREHQRLFQGDSQPGALAARRQAACQAMRFLEDFEPRLTGPVLAGTADAHSAINLHVYTDDSDAVSRFLNAHGIAHDHFTRQLRVTRGHVLEVPLLRFVADDISVELCVLPHDGLRQAPLDRIDEQPMRRATLAEIEVLLQLPENQAVATHP